MILIIILVILALVFSLLNGIHDSSNIVATMISSRAFSPRVALGITAACEFVGPFIFGVAVAQTIGHDIVSSETISLEILIAALFGANLWNLLTWFLGIPSSSMHAIIGGILGAVFVGAGGQSIYMAGIIKVLIALFTSPIIGLFFGFVITKLVIFLVSGSSPRVNWFFKRGQIITAMALALSHGANDAQKSMGIITLALVAGGYIASFQVPFWVVLSCSFTIALGTSLGGWRLIRTLGGKFYKIRPIHGFNTQLASAIVILGNSLLGGPVSTTQVVSTAIMGVGAAERINMVRWEVGKDILITWFLTIPANALMAAGIYWIIMQIKFLF